MVISKTSKVWMAGVGGGMLVAVGGALAVTGVGAGAGAVAITSGLAAIGGSMLGGIGVIAAGSGTAAAIAAAIASKMIKDPEFIALAEKLKKANVLYSSAKQATAAQKEEIAELNKRIGEILQSKKKDREELDRLNERLILLIDKLQNAKVA